MRVKRLLLTKHGSHLYNLATAGSDLDLYEIYDFFWQNYRPKKQASQKINTELDQTSVSLEYFVNFVYKGMPQAIETLFSTELNWLEHDQQWYEIRAGLEKEVKQRLPIILSTYKRTAWNFHAKDNIKKNRHALRLTINAQELKSNGYFNPSLTHPVIIGITEKAHLPWNERLHNFKEVFFNVFGDIE